MLENTSLADIAAVTGNNNDFGNGSIWIWLLVIILFIGGNGWGNNTQYATSSEVQNGFNNQNVMTRFDTLTQNQSQNAMDNANLINQNRYDNAQLINSAMNQNMQNTFNMTNAMQGGFNGVGQTLNTGFDSVNANINNLSHQIEQCACSLKTQMLQDKYDAAQNQLNLAEIASANAVQTQNILGNLGKWYSNPPVNPYYVYGQYGTTTIS